MNLPNSLKNSIFTGLLNNQITSDQYLRPTLLTNAPKEGKKVLSTILRELENCESFWFSVAFITTSGVATLMNTLMELERKGVPGKILTSQYLNFTHPEALRRLKRFKNIELKIATHGDFHSKGYLFKKDSLYNLIIGSSNLTQNALSANKEWNLKVSSEKEGELAQKVLQEFDIDFKGATPVTDNYIDSYQKIWEHGKKVQRKIAKIHEVIPGVEVVPNQMQKAALKNISKLRLEGAKKALLISATGTGKTYLSAFDVQQFKPKTFLFLVHRRTIAEKAKKTFENLLGNQIKMGMYSGKDQEIEADYIFSTVQTITKDQHLTQFTPDPFDYIVIDETHRAAAKTYERIMDYFQPKFMLGMTATPERTDSGDIFGLFDHNIAYEIRLHQALEEKMLSPFHYYGITDLTINGEEVDQYTDFNKLTSNERVKRIIEAAESYGCDDGTVRGLIFCSKNEIAAQLSYAFNERGYKTLALSGENSEEQRKKAIERLESKNPEEKLDYIFSVDIFNEGIDIPKVNQIIMLRPTESAIIFVQQLGRGLRKTNHKEYLTVIDFIGNYQNNYLVPIALYGDMSYNKDTLRKLISTGSSYLPGVSTVNFDQITKEKIFESINNANMQLKKDLKKDFDLLKFKLGVIPKMMDFIEHGSRDPFAFVGYSKSYFNFVQSVDKDFSGMVTATEKKWLELFSSEINNAKRIEETELIKILIEKDLISFEDFKQHMKDKYGFEPSDETLQSCVWNLNFTFTKAAKNGNLNSVELNGNKFIIAGPFKNSLSNPYFKEYLLDSIDYGLYQYKKAFKLEEFHDGFLLYQKYSRKDVFRIFNWIENPNAQNVGGYMISPNKSNCPIFVNYHKEEEISNTTKYEDGFLSPLLFQWMSKSRRTLESNDVKTIRNYKAGLRLPLFIKKENVEGTEFYFMGDITPIDESFVQTTLKDDNEKDVNVVKVEFTMNVPVEDNLYNYLVKENKK